MTAGDGIGATLLALLICGTLAAAEVADRDHGSRHHFLVSWHDGEVELTRVDSNAPPADGHYKFSCSSFRVEQQGKQRVITFVDAELESRDRVFVAKEMSVYARGPGVKMHGPMVGSKFKSDEARRRYLAQAPKVNQSDMPSGIDAGMRESAKEHRARWMHVINRQEPYSVRP